jgi:hypothetical protein
VNGDHYVALLPKTEEVINEETYTHFTGFMSDEENQAFRNRELQNIPTNEIPFAVNQGPFIYHIFFNNY